MKWNVTLGLTLFMIALTLTVIVIELKETTENLDTLRARISEWEATQPRGKVKNDS